MRLVIHTDGGSRGNPGPAAIGVVIIADGVVVAEVAQTIGIATNNEAEYRAVLASLEWLVAYDKLATIQNIVWKLDSKLVVEQLSRKWKIKEPRMLSYAQTAWKHLQSITSQYTFTHIPREENSAADALVNQALDAAE
ncbi:ribonuclease HI family protein [Candidatus Woesebacteria bacterium]|nr:ribonuclease HI family protein [Candidatus Woesebacteria bacterium]